MQQLGKFVCATAAIIELLHMAKLSRILAYKDNAL